ncbi:hypothetical protein Ancab_018166 [Ancistrocladus abbreviatus]
MEVKVVVLTPPSSIGSLDINSGCSSPYVSAPSSPPALNERFNHLLFYYSAPNSPRSVSSSQHHQRNVSDLLDASGAVCSSIPFNWEEKPGIPKFHSKHHELIQQDHGHKGDDDEFEFFSGHLDADRLSLSADELFDGGTIRPLKPPPRLLLQHQSTPSTQQIPSDSLKSPRSPISKFQQAFSPRNKEDEKHNGFDHFEAALERSRIETRVAAGADNDDSHRGRSGSIIPDTNSRGTAAAKIWRLRRGIGRSLSPIRVSKFALLQQGEKQALINQQQAERQPNFINSNFKDRPALPSLLIRKPANRKWKLRDLLLFRSPSEGSLPSKDQLKYKCFAAAAALQPKNKNIDGPPSPTSNDITNIEVKKTAEIFRSITCSSSSDQSSVEVGSISSQRRMGQQIPAPPGHELHHYYTTVSRAVSEEMKKKTSLPYRHAGLWGCLGFNSSASASFRELSRGRGHWFF